MQSSIIKEISSKKYIAEKLEKLVSEREEMNDASLDASRYKGDVCKFLESLPEDEFIKILGRLVKEMQEPEGYGGNCPQDLENQDATDKSNLAPNNNLKNMLKKEKAKVEHFGNQGQPATVTGKYPEVLENQDATDTGHLGPNNLKDLSTKENTVQVEHFGNQVQPATDTGNCPKDLENQDATTGYHGRDIRDNLSTCHDESEGQAKHHRDRQPWEFPPTGKSHSLTPQKDAKDHGLPVKSAHNENKDSDSVNTRSTSESFVPLDEEPFDPKGSRVDSGTDDRQLGSTTPIEACADNNRKILHASEHVQTLDPGSKIFHSEPHNACTRSRVQDVQAQLPEQPNLQNLHVFELLVPQLVETVCNNSKVALAQANRETQNVDIQGTSCSNCNALQEENDHLEDEVATLNEKVEQMQEQITELEESLSNQDYEIRILKQQNQQLLMQFASCEETIKSQHEDKKDDKKIIDLLIERNKKWQEELNLANKRAFEFALKREEEFDALLMTMKDRTKDSRKSLWFGHKQSMNENQQLISISIRGQRLEVAPKNMQKIRAINIYDSNSISLTRSSLSTERTIKATVRL
ncbi:uncharacterized protein LOC116290888 isoform X2 [Actinia tenebrosa]|uniref:Uncharacterized protein LOC116290888 isoform X2 n=1 Tax=Actinia tenebrosa TaxID=6105 RepID=A0A6P8HMK3_ACTTE|nr:uncharacterized protein LOC116290888 isoform X2 [Actinia tenebrosa]